LKKIREFISTHKLYVYIALVVIANNLPFLSFLGTWFITFGILITMPLFGLDFLLALMVVAVDGMFKMISFYFERDLFTYYPVYLVTTLVFLSLLQFALKRLKRERYAILSELHTLKSEAIDIESSLPQTLNRISHKDEKGSGIINLIQSREDSYKNIISILKQSIHPYSIFLYLYNQIDDIFYVREFDSEALSVNIDAVRASDSILHAVALERRPISLRNISKSQYSIPFYDKNEGIKSVIALPLQSGKRLKGILCLDSLEADRFGIREEEIIKGLAKELIKVIDSTEAMAGLAKMKDELEKVCELGTRLNKQISEEETIDILMDISKRFVDYDFSCFVSFDSEAGKNKIVRIRSENEDKNYEGRDFACDDKLGLASWVIRNNVPLEYCQIKGKKKEIILFNRNFKIPFKYNSVLILPVRSLHSVIGVYILASDRGNLCRSEDKSLLEGVCAQIGIALENARMYETLKHLATSDGLTGLNNHRVFQETLSREVERYSRHPDKFSLLLIDIDHFKGFNDRYGHPIGDFVLKEISKILEAAARKIDLAARYGGEEFAIILINTDEEGSLKMAERIRKEVASKEFSTGELILKVTISVGVATFPTSAKNKQDLIEAADKSLYLAKSAGRNQVVHYQKVIKQMEQYKFVEPIGNAKGKSPTN
jgi:two-component system, cell cycle response regulator